MFIDINGAQCCKTGQNACGDAFQIRRRSSEGRVIAVLSDGLGSGVKANILALMTSTMLLRFMEKNISIQKASEIMMNSLPVDKIRGISYATFTAIDCNDEGRVHVVEEGNPEFLWFRGTELMVPEFRELVSESFPHRKLRRYRIQARLGDRMIFCSDGVTQSGLGRKEFPVGWKREGLEKFVRDVVAGNPEISSHSLNEKILAQAVANEPGAHPGDDISVCSVYFRSPRRVMLFTGAPFDRSRDAEYARVFAEFPGKKAISGGTTSNIISRELKRPITTPVTKKFSTLPPMSYMDGVDLITEGTLTLTRTLEYLQKGPPYPPDAAGKLADFLLSADVIEIMLGACFNQSLFDPSLPVQISLRRDLIRKITEELRTKYYKHVTTRLV